VCQVATQTAQGEQASQGTQAGAVAADAMQTATQTAQGEQASQGTQAGAVAVDATQTATQTAQGEQASQGTQAGAVAADAMQTATQTAQKELASQGTQNRGTTEDGNDPGGSKGGKGFRRRAGACGSPVGTQPAKVEQGLRFDVLLRQREKAK
jgi:hypothetical protein